jgi:hypothetical protein
LDPQWSSRRCWFLRSSGGSPDGLHLLPALAGEVVLGAVVDLVYLAFIRPCQGA